MLAALVADAGVALVMQSPAGAVRQRAQAEAATTAKKKKAAATLEILKDGVSVRRKGKEEFTPAEDGQKLFVGDTVKTDDTGFAQINYTDAGDTYTRLDVNTEFTLVSITDEEGNRKVSGSLDIGKTWNRTSALTESEEFEQEGAGATAAVVGTVFMLECHLEADAAGVDHTVCDFISMVHGVRIRTVDGEFVELAPLQECDATEITEEDSDLCDAPSDADLEELLNDAFVAANFFLDYLAGYTDLPEVQGIVVVNNGEVTSFTPTSSTPPNSTPPNNNPPATPVATSISLALDPQAIPADGTSQSTATATVLDQNNQPMSGQVVNFATDGDASVPASAVTDSNGEAGVTITASNTAGTETITATLGSLEASALLDETSTTTPSAANNVKLHINAAAMPADGCSQTGATITVKDANGNPLSGQTVSVTSDGDIGISSPGPTDSNGQTSVTLTASTTQGQQNITAAVGAFHDTKSINLNSGTSQCATSTSSGTVVQQTLALTSESVAEETTPPATDPSGDEPEATEPDPEVTTPSESETTTDTPPAEETNTDTTEPGE